MARLHEYEGKALLKQFSIPIPSGVVGKTPDDVRAIAASLEKPVMVKAQAWVTGRASKGWIKRAATPEEAEDAARSILGQGLRSETSPNQTETSPNQTETSPNQTETSPNQTETSPNRTETSPNRTETSPNQTETSPNRTETSPNQTEDSPSKMETSAARKEKGFTVQQVLVEEQLDIEREFYAGVIIDDQAQAPLVMFSSIGGTGIEAIAAAHPDQVARTHVDIVFGFRDYQARDLVRKTGIGGRLQRSLGSLLVQLYNVARRYEARAAEINPLVLTKDGKLYAADCRITVDDYAVFRHPDLGIEIAREYDRPPTALERIAYAVEANDYRGTFYFIQMATDFEKGEGYIGFHGAGGGGSMMSMDAVLRQGYKLATFVDTSGNPPASKVYRAARIVMAAGPIDGYFGSGSGVASQEQFHSARGLVKAFLEEHLAVPAVIRLGGNAEDQAVEILERVNAYVPAPVEGYKKDDSPDFCAQRLDTLIKGRERGRERGQVRHDVAPPAPRPAPENPYTFETVTGGTVTLDHAICATCEHQVCVETCAPQILSLNAEGLPVLNITLEAAKKGGCIECLACEVECRFHGAGGGYVHLPIPGLEAY